MPIYGYTCDKCSEEFELLMGANSEEAEVVCPKCGSTKATKSFRPFSVKNAAPRSKAAPKECGGDCSACPMQ